MALSGLAASAGAQTPVSSPAVQLLRDACVATEMERAAYDALATERAWSPRPYVAPIDTPDDWGSRYIAGSAQTLLIGSDRTRRQGSTTYPAFRSCNVVMVRPTGEWRADMEALAGEFGFKLHEPDRRNPYSRFVPGEGQKWRKRGSFITWSHRPSDGILRLEIYRSLDGGFRFPPS